MSYINTIDINGEIYNLGNLTDGYHTVDLPKALTKNDIFILQGDVVDNLEDTAHNKPLSAYQGNKLNEKIDTESQKSTDRAVTITENLNNEILRSTNEDDKLDTKIDTEIQRAKDAESTLTSNLNTEVTRATGVENDLNTAIANEKKRATDVETGLNTAISNEKDRADKAEKANAAAIKAVTDDYLKSSDKTELKSAINTEKSRIDAFLAAAETGDKAIDTLKEIQSYIDTHGEAVTKMAANIGKNATDIKALQDTVGVGGSSSTGLFKTIAEAESSAKSYADDTFVKQTNIVNNLSTNSRDEVLSAAQGKILNDTKVDKVSGKGLSTNDYDNTAKGKVDAIPSNPKYTDTVYDDSTLANRVSAIENTAVIYPKLTDAQKTSISSLIKSYRNINSRFRYHRIEGTQTQHSKAATRNDYASKDTVLSDNVDSNGRYKIQCSLFVQLIWMGRKASDFPSDTSLYTSTINKLFDWGYYFDFSLRKRVYGMHIGDGANTKYNGFVKPNTNNYNESYSYTTTYTGATDDPSGMGQTYTNFMGASEMARELYAMGCEIPYSELDVGDLVFFRTPSIVDGKNDASEWMSFRNINHVAIVSRIDASGNPVFAEAIETFDSSPIMLESIESVANAWQAPRCSALMRWAVMCARHPVAFSKGGNVPSNITVI